MAASLIHQLPSLDSLRPSIFGRSHSYEEQHRALPSPLEVSRPPSTASTQSSYFHTPPPPAAQHTRQRHSSMVNLPALSSLTPLISASGGRPPQSVFGLQEISPASTYPPQYGMATVAPGQSNSQGADEPPACQNCSTFKTPLWRRDDNGSVLCNACGLFLKLHGRPRPISLKTDVIKSRNRVKIPQQAGQKRKAGPSLAAAYPDVASGGPRRAQQDSALLDNSQTQGPLSGSSTPNAYTPAQPAHPSNIAPQHMFDSASLSNNDAHALAFNVNSPSFNAHGGRQESPSTALLNGASHDALIAENNSLKTRVSELEVINELFRGRVAELERELEARRAIETGEARQAVEAAMRGNAAAEANNNFNAEARQRSDAGLGDIDESNNDNTNEGNTGPATTASVTRSSKRVRMSDLVDDHDEEAASPTAEE